MKLNKLEYVSFVALLTVLISFGFYFSDIVFTPIKPLTEIQKLYLLNATAQDARIVPRLKTGTTCSFVYAAADSMKTCTLNKVFNDTELHSLKLVIPNFGSSTPTATLSIKDPAGSTLYSQAAIAESTTTYIRLSRPLTGGSSFTVLLSTAAGAGGGTITLTPWIYTP